MALPINTLSSLHTLQDDEDHKPRVSWNFLRPRPPPHKPPPNDGSLALSTRDDVQYVTADLRVTSQLSKISWLPDILVFHSSIIPTVLGPVFSVSLFAGSVAVAALMWGKEVGLTNNVGESAPASTRYRGGARRGVKWADGVVPLLSVVVGLLLGEFPFLNSCEV
jgi:putative membrane protein